MFWNQALRLFLADMDKKIIRILDISIFFCYKLTGLGDTDKFLFPNFMSGTKSLKYPAASNKRGDRS